MIDPKQALHKDLTQWMASITAYYPENQFKSMLYNLAPNADFAASLQQNKFQIRSDNPGLYYSVDASLFSEALSHNPDPSRLYPCQINSCSQLCERVKSDIGASSAFNGALEDSKRKLREIDVELARLATEKLQEVTRDQANLLLRMCAISQHLERCFELQNALTRDPETELKLRARIEALTKKLEVAQKLHEVTVPDVSFPELKVPEQSLPDVVQVLREQRNNIAELRKTVLQDTERVRRLEAYFANRPR